MSACYRWDCAARNLGGGQCTCRSMPPLYLNHSAEGGQGGKALEVECICAEYDSNGVSTCGATCPAHSPVQLALSRACTCPDVMAGCEFLKKPDQDGYLHV